MKLIEILVSNNVIFDQVSMTPENYSKFKEYLKKKFRETDTQERPPLAFTQGASIDGEPTEASYCYEDELITKYTQADLVLEFNPRYLSKREVLQFTTMYQK